MIRTIIAIAALTFAWSLYCGVGAAVSADGKEVFKSKCLGSCHAELDPASLTSSQWESLIAGGEHDIFADVPLDGGEKTAVLEFLKHNAQDSQRTAEGIGVWN